MAGFFDNDKEKVYEISIPHKALRRICISFIVVLLLFTISTYARYRYLLFSDALEELQLGNEEVKKDLQIKTLELDGLKQHQRESKDKIEQISTEIERTKNSIREIKIQPVMVITKEDNNKQELPKQEHRNNRHVAAYSSLPQNFVEDSNTRYEPISNIDVYDYNPEQIRNVEPGPEIPFVDNQETEIVSTPHIQNQPSQTDLFFEIKEIFENSSFAGKLPEQTKVVIGFWLQDGSRQYFSIIGNTVEEGEINDYDAKIVTSYQYILILKQDFCTGVKMIKQRGNYEKDVNIGLISAGIKYSSIVSQARECIGL